MTREHDANSRSEDSLRSGLRLHTISVDGKSFPVDIWLKPSDQIFMEMVNGGYDKIFAPYQVRVECNVWHQFEDTRNQHLLDFYWKRMGMHSIIEERECYIFPYEKNFKASESFFSGTEKRYVALHSTTGVPTKDWPYFNDLSEELSAALPSDAVIVQVGARGDKIINGAIDLRGRFELLDLAAFLSRCSVFVGLDSGLSYMADAMKTPTIVIQGSTDPVTSGPISSRVLHLFAKETGYDDCQVIRCHMNCRHEVNCNTRITVPMVIEKIKECIDSAKVEK